MGSGDEVNVGEMKVDANNLDRETFTDMRAATLRRFVPVKPDGSPDASRQPVFIGQAHIMSQNGPVPIQFPLEAANVQEAMEQFPRPSTRPCRR